MACLPSFASIVFSEANDDAAGGAAVVVARSTIIDCDYSGRAGENRYPPRVKRDIPDGCRVTELLGGSTPLVDVADCLAAYKSEALEPVDNTTTGSLITK